jgi:hypothetical protein
MSIDLLGCILSAAMGLVVGWWANRDRASRRQVDRLMRREMRAVHSAEIEALAEYTGVMPSPITGMGSDLIGTLEGAERLAKALKDVGHPVHPVRVFESFSDEDRRQDGGTQ